MPQALPDVLLAAGAAFELGIARQVLEWTRKVYRERERSKRIYIYIYAKDMRIYICTESVCIYIYIYRKTRDAYNNTEIQVRGLGFRDN